MNLQDWLFIVTAAAAVGQVGALVALVLQLRDMRKQTKASTAATRNSTRMNVWLEMLTIDRFFCEHPELREHFYGSSKVFGDSPQAQQWEATAEMVLDFAECMLTQREHLDWQADGWGPYYAKLFNESEIMRKFWQHNHFWFKKDLRDFIDNLEKQESPGSGKHKAR
ncbi:MAG TPA: hypothetical protein VGS08_05300 [Candidatus Saccharimonadales bacterium]|nr:hypothetical protein [Candidatus Saccharimonadales bacterium]